MLFINSAAITGEMVVDAAGLQTEESPNLLSDSDVEDLLAFQQRVRAAIHEGIEFKFNSIFAGILLSIYKAYIPFRHTHYASPSHKKVSLTDNR